MLPRPTGKGSSSGNGIREKEAPAACLLGSGLAKRPGLVCVCGVGGAYTQDPVFPGKQKLKGCLITVFVHLMTNNCRNHRVVL